MSSNACPLPPVLQAEPVHLGWWYNLHIMPTTIPTTMNGFHHHAAVQFGSVTWHQKHTQTPTGCSNTVHISIYYKSYTDEIITVVLHTVDDKKVTLLLYATLNSLMMGQ
jgi:hypothetical protein